MNLTPRQRFECKVDPVRYCEYMLGENITVEAAMDPKIPFNYANAPIRQQRQMMRSVAQHQRTAVAGSNMFGKSHTLARLASWWLDTHAECLVVVTAPRFDQVEKNFVVPFQRLRSSLEIPTGKANSKTYMPNPNFPHRQVFCTTATAPENFAGWHDYKNRLFLFDEASAIHKDIWDAVRAMLGRKDSKIIAMGNPIREADEERFMRFKEASESPFWKFFSFSAWDHPNVVHGRPVIPGSMAPEWPEEMRVEYGEDSPIYIARVLGQFATSLSESMYAQWLDRIMVRGQDPKMHSRGALGIDPAGKKSGDKMAVCRWGWDPNGQDARIIFSKEIATGEQMAQLVRDQFDAGLAEVVGVDVNGLGYYLPELLKNKGIHEDAIFEYVGNKSARSRRRFESKYDEDAFILRQIMQDATECEGTGLDFAVQYNESLHIQLNSRKFVTRKGRLALVDKYAQLKASPDEFDAMLIAMDAALQRRRLDELDKEEDGFVPVGTGAFTPIDEVERDAFFL